MAEEKKGGALDGVNIASLKAQAEKKKQQAEAASKEAASAKAEPEKSETDEKKAVAEAPKSDIFDWGDDDGEKAGGKEASESMPSINDLKAAKTEETPMPENPNVAKEEKKSEPSAEELGGGIVIDHAAEQSKPEGVNIQGPLAPGSETMKGVEKTMQELNEMTRVAALRRQAAGEKPKAQTVVEILIDKTGMNTVEFSDEERQKMKAAKKIKLTAIQDESLSKIVMNKPKAIKQKTLIAKAFSKQFAPFVAAASGYSGKMRNMSSLEVINLITINQRTKNSADAILQRANLIYSKMEEASIGSFENFDDFAKKTALIDMDVMLFALIRATYPEEETILMNCGNPKCTHKQKNNEGKVVDVPNQFTHRYKNTDILLAHKISDKLKAQVQAIHEASFTEEDAKAIQEKSPEYQEHRYALGDDREVIVDVCCPTIYDYVENVAKKIDLADFNDDESYVPATSLASFVKRVMLKDTDSDDPNAYNVFEDTLSIIDIIYRFPEDMLELLNQIVSDDVMDYQYKFGFKAETVVCPICGHAFEEDAEVDINNLVFLQAQHHMTNA